MSKGLNMTSEQMLNKANAYFVNAWPDNVK